MNYNYKLFRLFATLIQKEASQDALEAPPETFINEGWPESFAVHINTTLLHHLPGNFTPQGFDISWEHLSASLKGSSEQDLAKLAARNMCRRINLNYPEDILDEDELATATHELLQSIHHTTWNKSQFSGLLKQALEYGFLLPRYRVQHSTRWKKHREPLDFRVYGEVVFNAEGRLQELHFVPLYSGKFAEYKEQGRVVDNPTTISHRSKRVKEYTPLFTFSQVGHLIKVYDIFQSASVNSIFGSPRDYANLRKKWTDSLNQILEGIGNPQFCRNPECQTPLRSALQNRYCSDQCQSQAADIKRQSRKRPSKKEKPHPFEDHSEHPSPTFVD